MISLGFLRPKGVPGPSLWSSVGVSTLGVPGHDFTDQGESRLSQAKVNLGTRILPTSRSPLGT